MLRRSLYLALFCSIAISFGTAYGGSTPDHTADSLDDGDPAPLTDIVNEDFELHASDAHYGDYFGRSVSISGDVALIGAFLHDSLGLDAGAAYIFRYDGTTWAEEQMLVPSDGSSFNWFGLRSSISGDVALVGEQKNDSLASGAGAAYIFRYDGTAWVEEQMLLSSDGSVDGAFGCAVSISGDVALVGEEGNDSLGRDVGVAYIFRYDGTTWVKEQMLAASDGSDVDKFGGSVWISGNAALIGAAAHDSLGNNTGAAYVFRYDGTTWVEEQKLVASDGLPEDFFGYSVSISGDVALVGAWLSDPLGLNSGSAYLFRYDGTTWVEEQKFLASDGAAYDHFGISVAVSGDAAVIGAHEADALGSNSGAAYLFRYDGSTWHEEAILLGSDGAPYDYSGMDVFVQGDVAMIGAPYHDDTHLLSGSVFVYDLTPTATVMITPTGPTSVSPGDTLFFDTSIQNNTAGTLTGDYWLSVRLPNSNEIMISESFINTPNPMSGQVAPFGTLNLSNEVYIPSGAPAGSYIMIGRIGLYPAAIIDERRFDFQVTP